MSIVNRSITQQQQAGSELNHHYISVSLLIFFFYCQIHKMYALSKLLWTKGSAKSINVNFFHPEFHRMSFLIIRGGRPAINPSQSHKTSLKINCGCKAELKEVEIQLSFSFSHKLLLFCGLFPSPHFSGLSSHPLSLSHKSFHSLWCSTGCHCSNTAS